MENQGGYYIVIPGYLRADKRLSSDAKLLYGEIAYKCNVKGHCWATNQFFADIFDVNIRSIQRYIKELEAAGYLTIEIVTSKDGSDRKIYLNEAFNREVTKMSPQKATKPSRGNDKKDTPTDDIKVMHNSNTENINTNIHIPLIPTGIKVDISENENLGPDVSKKQAKVKTKVDQVPMAEFGTFPKFIAIYDEWFKGLHGIPPDLNGESGAAAKAIIVYMRKVAKLKAEERHEILTGLEMEGRLLIGWKHVLTNWDKLEPFLQNKTKLSEIRGQIQNIVNQIKNGKKTGSNQPTGGNVQTLDLAHAIASSYSTAGKAGPGN